MGTVWRAHDELLGRDVAIKEVLLPPELSDADREQRHARTIREARSAARLSHPGAVTVYDVVEHEGRPWIVMELVSAPSLQSVIDSEGPLAPARVAELGRQILAALRAAHAAGIVHRDIKPSNVLVAGERAVVTDFGIAALEGDSTLTGTGVLIGSPAYIAPERARGEPSGPAGDLWSLGATLYAAVEGRSPFERSGPVSTLAAIMAEEPPPPRLAGALTPALAGLLRRDPADRITAAEADRLLTQAAQGTQPGLTTVTWTSPQHVKAARMEAARLEAARSGTPGPEAAIPTPMPAATPSTPFATAQDPVRSRRSPALVVASGLAGALLVTAFGAVWLLGRTSAGQRPTAASTSATTQQPTGRPAVTAPTDPSRPLGSAQPTHATKPRRSSPVTALGNGDDPVPASWSTRTESGFSVSVPTTWTRRSDGDNVFYEDATKRYLLQIGTTSWSTDPQTQAERESRSIAQSFSGYRNDSIAPTTYLDVAAADLTFDYDRSSGTVRATDRFFRIGDACYAIYFRMPADQWAAHSSEYLDQIFGGFSPG